MLLRCLCYCNCCSWLVVVFVVVFVDDSIWRNSYMSLSANNKCLKHFHHFHQNLGFAKPYVWKFDNHLNPKWKIKLKTSIRLGTNFEISWHNLLKIIQHFLLLPTFTSKEFFCLQIRRWVCSF
jgi:hypothetical protein